MREQTITITWTTKIIYLHDFVGQTFSGKVVVQFQAKLVRCCTVLVYTGLHIMFFFTYRPNDVTARFRDMNTRSI